MFPFGRCEYNICVVGKKPTVVVVLLTDEKISNELFSILAMDSITTRLYYNIIIFIYARITDMEKCKTNICNFGAPWK